ncbi:E3 ubiquitin-protein ligase RGLG1-like isoform X1 [Juglans regia]|uniref:E3 ubiquitin-protein ligase RGLG1-like isoform X1 n=2 Tax=Juglans regia TaxID=51240 RepID=A0A6P9E2D5_JUGRE|nr:E3 ubiquitin-protein ligase RGLG1-like isoform X1 [Juglans regia]
MLYVICRIELMGGACCSRHVTAVSPSQDFEPRQHFASAPPIYVSSGASEPRRLYVEDSNIAVRHNRLEEVLEALAHAGLESSNLIVGIDFTKSNEWTGTESFYRRSLHHIGDEQNPYEQAMSIIGKALASFNENNLIRCFGFGDATARYQEVFSFYPDEKLCNGYEEVLGRYRELVPYVQLAGPTSFAPVIEMAITVIEKSGGQYHVLLIIADGKADTLHLGKTFDAIVKESEYPLSIILVGVGDGPWDSMREFIDSIPVRGFDNFQFVNFTEIMSKNMDQPQKEAEFSLAGLIKLPSQYKKIIELNLLGVSRGMAIHRAPLPPPMHTTASFGTQESSIWRNLILSAPSSNVDHTVGGFALPCYTFVNCVMHTLLLELAICL